VVRLVSEKVFEHGLVELRFPIAPLLLKFMENPITLLSVMDTSSTKGTPRSYILNGREAGHAGEPFFALSPT
jgi:hypothetical protein